MKKKQQRFILLHSAEDNSPIVFDAKVIIGVIKKTSFGDFSNNLDDDYTNVIIDTPEQDEVYYVNESVEKVYDMLSKIDNDSFGFIKLHEQEDNAVCILNYTYIDILWKADRDDDFTNIVITNCDINLSEIDVNESVEKIYKVLHAMTLDEKGK